MRSLNKMVLATLAVLLISIHSDGACPNTIHVWEVDDVEITDNTAGLPMSRYCFITSDICNFSVTINFDYECVRSCDASRCDTDTQLTSRIKTYRCPGIMGGGLCEHDPPDVVNTGPGYSTWDCQ